MTEAQFLAEDCWISAKTHGPGPSGKYHICDRDWTALCGKYSMYFEQLFFAAIKIDEEKDSVVYAQNRSSSIYEHYVLMDMSKRYFCKKCLKKFEKLKAKV